MIASLMFEQALLVVMHPDKPQKKKAGEYRCWYKVPAARHMQIDALLANEHDGLGEGWE